MSAALLFPNVLLLVLDSVRAANVGCYGYDRATTPTLDRLAREGVRYEQAISVGCWTLPVHATLFTGLYPASHGVRISRSALPDGFPTLARRLGNVGYQTACFSNNPYISHATGLAQGFDAVEELWLHSRPQGIGKPRSAAVVGALRRRGRWARPAIHAVRAGVRIRGTLRRLLARRSDRDRGARLTNERIEAWLETRDPERPFFAFVNYMECHEPYAPPHPWNRRFRPSRRDEPAAALRGLYDGTLAYLDAKVGELVACLEARGILDDTVLIVASDHGDLLGEHGRTGHRVALYEELVHVPLIVRYPPLFPAGTTVAEVVELGDLHPTILELAGASDGSEGGAGFRMLLGGDWPEPRYAIAENTAPKSLDGLQTRMLRDERWKLIWSSDGRHELYDLGEDPRELRNLAPERRDVLEGLLAQLEVWERSLDGRVEAAEAEYDEPVLARLRALGYVDS